MEPKQGNLEILWHVFNALNEKVYNTLIVSRCARDLHIRDPWSYNKLQATLFLNAPEEIQLALIEGI